VSRARGIASFVVTLLVLGFGWVFVYFAVLRDMLRGGLLALLSTIRHPDLTSIVWWRDFIWYFWPIVIVLFSLFATSYVIAMLAVEMRYLGLERPKSEERYVVKYTPFQRVQYYLLYVLFFIVAFTGFVMHFGNNPFVKFIYVSREAYVTLHVVAGVLLGALALLHVGYYGSQLLITIKKGGWQAAVQKFPLLRVFNFSEVLTNVSRLYNLAFTPRAPRPEWDKYDIESLLHYWGEYFGMTVIGVTGVAMIFYGASAWAGFAWAFHVREAALAVAIWLLMILPLAHFRPSKFPVDRAFLSGKVPLSEVERENPLWYKRILSGKERVGHSQAGEGDR